jgi:RNA:NAD 2'-phosphotransferase (TPT1/KptA family)
MSTTTIAEVIQVSSRDEEAAPPELVPFSAILDGASFAAVDNSGSTAGAPLLVAKAFVNALGVNQVSLWNYHCSPPVPSARVVWQSVGGTCPASIFEPRNQVPNNSTCFVFMTDGMIDDTARLARHASVTAHLPSLLVLFGPRPDPTALVRNYNVSVVMAHFTATRTAAVVVINDQLNPIANLITAKGDWARFLPSPPPLTDDLRLGECPQVSVHELQRLPSQVHEPMAAGSLPLAGGRVLRLDALLSLSDGRDLVTQLSQGELEDVARSYFASSNLAVWRQQLNRWLILVNQDAAEQVEQTTRQAAFGVHALIRRLGEASSPNEARTLRAQLQEAIHIEASRTQQASEEVTRTARQPRAIINAALAAVTALEQTGMNATSLGSLSNRAARAHSINANSLASFASLSTEGAPEAEDLVLHENGPVALCLRAMDQPDHNTGDEALNQALRVGQLSENAVFEPTIVALEISNRIEELDASPLTRHRLSVCLPIVHLQDEHNRNAVFQRLCLVFMNGLSMQHVWLIALSSILRTIETESWADPEASPTGRLLSWFAAQIMQHVTLPAGSRLSPRRRQPINMALSSILQNEILTVHSSVEEVSVILRLLHRFGAPAAFSRADLRRAMQARIATAIPQMHRNWLQANAAAPWADQGPSSLAALLSSVYQTRVDSNGAHVPVTGTGRVVESLEGLLFQAAQAAVASFARNLGIVVDDLVTPGLTLVILGTLDRVTGPHVSSTAAVQAVQTRDAASAAEMHPSGVGTATRDEVIDYVRRRLAWARTPLYPLSPFTTPFGPSVFWFYAMDGSVINMAEGFEVIPGEVEEDIESYFFRLTECLRANRGRLMSRYYGTLDSGAFASRTTITPMYRAMADEFREMEGTEDFSQPSEATAFVHRVVQRIVGRSGTSAGNTHGEHMERDIAMLLPSLLESIAFHASNGLDARAEPRPIPLVRRVELELGCRSPNNMGSPPNAIWVPHDDPELLETLLRVQQEQQRARLNVLRRRLIGAPQEANVDEPRGLRVSDMGRFQRSVTWFLRHGATIMRPDGYVPIQAVLDSLDEKFRDATVDQVLEVAETDAKGRFSVIEDGGVLLIRANQGHSITSVDPEQLMTPIENASDVPVCLHGTYEDAYQNILRSGGLNRMQRQAIQMAVGLPNDPEVRSGIRLGVDIVIYIDVERATRRHGLRFFRSANNVICCVGPIPTDCFTRVVRLADGTLFDF